MMYLFLIQLGLLINQLLTRLDFNGNNTHIIKLAISASILKTWLNSLTAATQDQSFFYTPVPITQQELTQLLINGEKLLQSWWKEDFSHSLIQLIKVLLQVILFVMHLLLVCSLIWDSKWLLHKVLLKIWDYMVKELVLYMLFARVNQLLIKYWVNSN